MNRYLSLIELNIRRSMWKVIVLAAAFAAGELGWFAWRVSAGPQMSLFMAGDVFAVCFVICLAASALLLGWKRAKGSKPVYSLMMLSVSERARYAVSLLCDLAAMFFVWASQALVVLAASRIYMSGAGYAGGPQGALVEIYSSAALGAIVPLEYTPYLVMGLICTASLAFAAARMEQAASSGDFPAVPLLIIVLAAGAMLAMARARGQYSSTALVGFAAFFALFSLYSGLVHWKDAEKGVDDGE